MSTIASCSKGFLERKTVSRLPVVLARLNATKLTISRSLWKVLAIQSCSRGFLDRRRLGRAFLVAQEQLAVEQVMLDLQLDRLVGFGSRWNDELMQELITDSCRRAAVVQFYV
jgi:hypothetical protein